MNEQTRSKFAASRTVVVERKHRLMINNIHGEASEVPVSCMVLKHYFIIPNEGICILNEVQVSL